MARLPLSVAALLVACAGCSSQTPSPDAIRPQVQQLVRTYVDAINKADVTAMMEVISRDPGVSSINDGSITRGWEAIRTENDAVVGKVSGQTTSFGSIDVVPLGATHALVTLPVTITVTTEQGSTQETGATTLVLEKSPKGWKIIHEHYSSQPEEQGG